jgi:hypothetical protein
MPNAPATSSKLNIGYLDFDTIKMSLRDYLRSQAVFKDYDFEGSGLAVLLDILTYNTHYFGFYMNMIGNEMFLDSANLRSSVVSLAKMLNYTPRSVTSAQANISVTITSNNSAPVAVIEQNTPFSANVDGTTYNFVAAATYGATLSSGKYYFPNITLIEGLAYTFRITVDNSIPNQRFILPNPSIDTSTLSVRVQNSTTDTTLTTFVLATDLITLTSTTTAYFLQEVENQQFELVFGDGVIGQALVDGNIIIIDYILSDGSVANSATTFYPTAPLAGYPQNLTTVTTLIPAAGGLDPETTDEIRFTAPKNYQAQGRAVTVSDYILTITQQYTNTDSCTVWGGEDAVPPQYGKVFISIKPVDGFVITEAAKTLVVNNIIRQYNIVSVIPEFVDPDYTFIIVNCSVKYNPANTFKTDGDIQTGAYNAIVNYATSDLDKFNLEFRYSKLLAAIDNSDPSITNNQTSIQMYKQFQPVLNVATNYTFQTYNAILPGSVTSSTFVVVQDPLLLVPYQNGNTYYINDDRNGNLLLFQQGIGIATTSVRKVGTVDYTNGVLNLTSFMPYQANANGNINLIMTPQLNDVSPSLNNILFIQPTDVAVVAVPVPTTTVL